MEGLGLQYEMDFECLIGGRAVASATCLQKVPIHTCRILKSTFFTSFFSLLHAQGATTTNECTGTVQMIRYQHHIQSAAVLQPWP